MSKDAAPEMLTDGLGEVVDEIVSGRYDMKQAQKSILAAEMMERYLL